jgi:hypothetical protein
MDIQGSSGSLSADIPSFLKDLCRLMATRQKVAIDDLESDTLNRWIDDCKGRLGLRIEIVHGNSLAHHLELKSINTSDLELLLPIALGSYFGILFEQKSLLGKVALYRLVGILRISIHDVATTAAVQIILSGISSRIGLQSLEKGERRELYKKIESCFLKRLKFAGFAPESYKIDINQGKKEKVFIQKMYEDLKKMDIGLGQ